MLIATVWAYFFLPETKGKTLEEFDVILYVVSSSSQNIIRGANKNNSGYVSDHGYGTSARKAIDKDDVEFTEERVA
jgi:hypothetical protein